MACLSLLSVPVDCLFVWDQVQICQLDILTALSSKKSDTDILLASRKILLAKAKGGECLFTKQGVLKKTVGQAHKGWILKGTDNYTRFLSLFNLNSSASKSVELQFERRMLGQHCFNGHGLFGLVPHQD